MTSQVHPGVSVTATDTSVTGRIAQLRELQSELRTKPVTGSRLALKKLFYQIIRSTFTRQFRLNTGTVDLIETIYQELEGQRLQLRRQSVQMQEQIRRASPPAQIGDVPISNGEALASCGQTQDQARLNNIRPLEGFNHVYTSPAELRMPERVVLYSLIFGLQPRNCLEIGTFRGGSTAIICGAMDDTGYGQLACVDPMPRVDPELWSRIGHRCRMFEGASPDILPEVGKEMGVAFDFAFIDGNHTHEYIRRDIAGVLPLLADTAYLLFHDAHYDDVNKAIDEAVATVPELTDCGLLSVEPTVLHENNQTVTWAGLRLLRYRRTGAG
jgi:predicted O-methyltransferase YrrM